MACTAACRTTLSSSTRRSAIAAPGPCPERRQRLHRRLANICRCRRAARRSPAPAPWPPAPRAPAPPPGGPPVAVTEPLRDRRRQLRAPSAASACTAGLADLPLVVAPAAPRSPAPAPSPRAPPAPAPPPDEPATRCHPPARRSPAPGPWPRAPPAPAPPPGEPATRWRRSRSAIAGACSLAPSAASACTAAWRTLQLAVGEPLGDRRRLLLGPHRRQRLDRRLAGGLPLAGGEPLGDRLVPAPPAPPAPAPPPADLPLAVGEPLGDRRRLLLGPERRQRLHRRLADIHVAVGEPLGDRLRLLRGHQRRQRLHRRLADLHSLSASRWQSPRLLLGPERRQRLHRRLADLTLAVTQPLRDRRRLFLCPQRRQRLNRRLPNFAVRVVQPRCDLRSELRTLWAERRPEATLQPEPSRCYEKARSIIGKRRHEAADGPIGRERCGLVAAIPHIRFPPATKGSRHRRCRPRPT